MTYFEGGDFRQIRILITFSRFKNLINATTMTTFKTQNGLQKLIYICIVTLYLSKQVEPHLSEPCGRDLINPN